MAEWEREGRITAEQAATHPHRNVITRALGIDDEVAVDRWEIPPVVGDRYLLCSDGLTNELDDDAIAAVLREMSDPQMAAETLVARANDFGGRDNVTVVVVEVVTAAQPAEGGDLVVPADPPPPPPAAPVTPPAASPRRFTWRVAVFLLALVGLVGLTAGGLLYWARGTYFVGAGGPNAAEVVVFQGRPGGFLWFDPTEVEVTDLELAELPMPERQRVLQGHQEPTLDDARRYVETLASRVATTTTTTSTTTTTTTIAPATTEPAEGDDANVVPAPATPGD